MFSYYDSAFSIFERDGKVIVYSPKNHKMVKLPSKYSRIFYGIKSCNGRISDEEFANIIEVSSKNEVLCGSTELKATLTSAGFLYDSVANFVKSVEAVKSTMNDVKFAPRVAYVHPTQRCNLKCWYCFSKSTRNTSELETNVWLEIFEKLAKIGVSTLYVTGGEPFLRHDIDILLENAITLFDSVSVLTNGTMIPGGFIKKHLCRLNEIVISLDSIHAEVHERNRHGGQHSAILNTLRTIKDFGLSHKVFVRSVITRRNIKYIRSTRDQLRNEFGITNYIITRFLPNTAKEIDLVPSDEELAGIEDTVSLEKASSSFDCMIGRCGAGQGIIAINADGTLFPCQSFVGWDQFSFGTILSDEWVKVAELSESRRLVANSCVDNIMPCCNCDVRYLCGGGCPAIAAKIYGTIDSGVEFLCASHKKSVTDKLFSVPVVPIGEQSK